VKKQFFFIVADMLIIEKAYAKMEGGYENIASRSVKDTTGMSAHFSLNQIPPFDVIYCYPLIPCKWKSHGYAKL
jgi:hypothetical protein